MSKITVNLEQPSTGNAPQKNAPKAFGSSPAPMPNDAAPKSKSRRGLLGKILLVLGVLILLGGVAAAAGGYWWWTSLQKSPAYSLALLVDGARKDEPQTIEKYFDTNAVVEDFVSQLKDKTKERYGRGAPAAQLQQATLMFEKMLPEILPQIKKAAAQRIPQIIKEKAASAPQMSPWMMAAGIGRVATIEQSGDTATVKTEFQARQVELKMQKSGTTWKIVSVKDDVLADQIAEQVTQKVLAILSKKPGGLSKMPDKKTIEEIKKQLEQIAF